MYLPVSIVGGIMESFSLDICKVLEYAVLTATITMTKKGKEGKKEC